MLHMTFARVRAKMRITASQPLVKAIDVESFWNRRLLHLNLTNSEQNLVVSHVH